MEARNLWSVSAAHQYLPIVLLLVAAAGLSGCITEKVLKLREDRETEIASATRFRSVARVSSGWMVQNGFVFACTEFQDGLGAAPSALTLRLSDAAVTGRSFGSFMPTRSASTPEGGLPLHLYPLKVAVPGCPPPSGSTTLAVHTLRLSPDEQNRIPEIISSPDLFTWGLWEVVAAPTEYSGTDTIVMVTYDASNRVEAVQYVKGGE